MTDPTLSILIVSYNTREMTLACLRSVFDQTHVPFEVIVIDNASSDGSAEAIAAEFPQITLLAETTNHGFARANNIAAELVRGEYILLLNPDTVVLDGALDKLLAFARRTPEAKIWGGRTLFGDMSLNPTSCWRQMSLWSLFCSAVGLSSLFRQNPILNSEGYGGWDRASEREVDIVTGCLLLIRRDDWRTLGGFDRVFFMYAEEADLCLRARKMIGARPRITPKAEIIHYSGASEKVRSDKMVRLLGAKRKLIDRHFPVWQQPMANVLFTAVPASRSLALGVAARFSLRPAITERARVWAEVWARRGEWSKSVD